MENRPALSKELQIEVATFFEYAPPARLSRNLRKLLLSYLSQQRDGHNLDMDDLLLDLQSLFALLDAVQDEMEKQRVL